MNRIQVRQSSVQQMICIMLKLPSLYTYVNNICDEVVVVMVQVRFATVQIVFVV